MQIIYLDISNKGVVPTVYAKQGDVGRKFEVVLTDFGIPYYPPNGSVFSVWYSGSSGEGNYTDIGDRSAFSVNENKVAVEMIAQMFSADGAGILCLTLNSPDGNQISSWNIPYICEPVPGIDSEEAKSYYTAFSNAVKDLPYPDASLSAPGKAADAAAVGVALEGKAPAGYGLGTIQPIEWSDIDNITANGWYSAIVNGEITPGLSAFMAWIRVDALNADYACQTLYATGNTAILKRYKQGGTWSEWECLNPPMLPGVEYRTTERNEGKAVYATRVAVGTLVANGEVQIPIRAGNTLSILRFSGQFGNHAMPNATYGVWVDVQVVNASTILIHMHTAEPALVGSPVYVSIWYTKD